MHSFVSCLMHCVFSTKERRQLITPEIQNRLYPYLGGIARETTVGNHRAVVPTVEGWARITGLNTIFVDDRDPFAKGFQVTDRM